LRTAEKEGERLTTEVAEGPQSTQRRVEKRKEKRDGNTESTEIGTQRAQRSEEEKSEEV